MTFVASVSAGFERADRSVICPADAAVTRHRDLAVAWSRNCRWIDTADDGVVLAVVDGRFHNLPTAPANQASLLLERYRASGADVAKGLLGDFVVIILDRKRDTLLVARDPVGVRPWYQATAGCRHAGASQMAALTALPWVDTGVNEPIAIEYLAAVEQSRGETLYQGIRTLRPGQTWVRSGGRARTLEHHRWDVEPDLDVSWDDAAERCRVVFDEAVRCRVAGGPATSELSGGLDSSTVVGTLVHLGREDLLVGRMLFDGRRADERAYSDSVIEHWGLRAVSVPPWIPTADERRDLTQELARPCPDANFTMFTSLHLALLGEGRADGLTGLGGDDAFVAQEVGPRIISAVKRRQGDVLRRMAKQTVDTPRQAWTDLVKPTLGYLARPLRKKWLPKWVTSAARARADLRRLVLGRPPGVKGIDAIDARVAALVSGYDAAILETRAAITDRVGRRESHPFLDPRFIEATYGLDPWWPTRGGHGRALQVAAFRDRLAPAVAERRSKAEFSEVFWPQVLDPAAVARIRGGPLRQRGWLDPEGFDALVADAKGGMAKAAIPLFRCSSLDHWVRTQ